MRNYKNSFGTKLPVHYRLRFYTVDSISKNPKDLVLLESDIILKPKNKKQYFEVDLKDYMVELPKQGLFVGLQTINPNLNQPKEGLFYVVTPLIVQSYVKKSSSYHRDLGGKWYSFDNELRAIRKDLAQDLIMNVELKYYEN